MTVTAFPLKAFHSARKNAQSRGIQFDLTYEQWLAIWLGSGHFHERGRGAGQYVMARNCDAGSYAVGNVYITTGQQNTRDAVKNGRFAFERGATAEELQWNRSTSAKRVVPAHVRAQAQSYREAVRLAWNMRRLQSMNQRQLGDEAALYAPHVTDYLAADDSRARRDLPANAIRRFEAAVGNTVVSQWIAANSQLTVLEELQATEVSA